MFGIKHKRTGFRSPWQNGVAERWVGNCRRNLFDRVIVVDEHRLKSLMNEYVRYYHENRMHLGLAKQTPAGRLAQENLGTRAKVISMPRLGGLHHRCDIAA
jgi:transposase InsO family protein